MNDNSDLAKGTAEVHDLLANRPKRKIQITVQRLERIKHRMAEIGMSRTTLATEIGVTATAITFVMNRKTFRTKHFPAIARALGVDLAWLLGDLTEEEVEEAGQPDRTRPDTSEGKTAPVAIDAALLNVVDLQGRHDDERHGVPVTGHLLAFSRELLSAYSRADPEFLLVAQGVGDGMQPTLWDSDALLIDASRQKLDVADKIWLVRYAGTMAIKRLRPTPDGVRLMSDNPGLPDDVVAADDLEYLGLVVGVLRKL